VQLSWLIRGLRTGVLTTRYPRAPETMPASWRGVIDIDPARCRVDTATPPCVNVCLPSALRVEPASSGQPLLVLDPLACIACGRCISACPSGALTMTNRFELARRDHLTEGVRP